MLNYPDIPLLNIILGLVLEVKKLTRAAS